jgi:hypothetical protein
MNLTDVLALVGAVTGPLALFWDFAKWRLDKPTLKLAAAPVSDDKLLVVVANIGRSRTTLTGLDWLVFRTLDDAPRKKPERVLQTTNLSDDSLPVAVDSGMTWRGFERAHADLLGAIRTSVVFCRIYHSMSTKPVLVRVAPQVQDETITKSQVDIRLGLPSRMLNAFLSKLALIPLAVVVAALALLQTYKSTGVDDLRTQIYQPLLSDLESAGVAAQTVSTLRAPSMINLANLGRNGGLARIPSALRARLTDISTRCSQFYSAIPAVHETALREISARLLQLRSEDADRKWEEDTISVLSESARRGKGVYNKISFTMNHEGRTRGVKMSTAGGAVAVAPGGPTFVVRDWVEYSESVEKIEGLWGDLDFLYFDENSDAWYYRITRSDLTRMNVSLTDFLKPTHLALRKTKEFTQLVDTRPALQKDIEIAKEIVRSRIADPKRVFDLVSN